AVLVLASCGCTRPDLPSDAPPSASAPSSTPSPSPSDVETPPLAIDDLHGELLTIDGIRILRLWGTPAQMGHAHGFLLRDSILEVVDGYALDVIPPATLDAAGVLYTTVA